MSINGKIYHLIIVMVYCQCALWAITSLSGCNQTSKKIPPASALTSGNVTLLWNDIPGATSYNVYMSGVPGITKLRGDKISNVTNPKKIRQLEPGETYYFVVTVVDEHGESEESKELSYTAVANKIGIIYWKDLFEKSKQDYKSLTAETRPEINAAPERIRTEAERPPLAYEALSEGDSAKKNLQQIKKEVVETEIIKEDLTENSTPAAVHTETGTEPAFSARKKMRLKAAQIIAGSVFYIFFQHNSNVLTPKAKEKLDRLYEILANSPTAKLTLNGYSDSIGIPSYNQIVSEIRAITVKSYLLGKGIEHSRMKASGHGAERPLSSNKSAEGRHLNRRVEIELIIP